MAGNSRKVDVEVSISGEQKYKQAISELNAANKTLGAEMKRLAEEYKGNEESMDFLTQKGEKLQDMLDHQREKIEQLKEAVKLSAQTHGEASTKTQALAAQLANAETSAIQLERAIEENNAAMNENAASIDTETEELTGLGDTLGQIAQKFGVSIPDSAKTALNGIEGFSAGTVAKMAVAAAAVAAVIKVVKELTDLTIQVAADMDNYLTESQVTGVATEMLQAWDYAAPLIDTDAETIKSAMVKITKAMGDSSEQFDALGVSVRDADGNMRSAEDVFYDVIDSLSEMAPGAERDAAAMELMGKSAQELNPLINAGSDALKEYGEEAKTVGYILSKDQVDALGAVDDSYQRLQLTVDALKKQLAADFAPAAESSMELFTDCVRTAGEWLEKSGLITNLASIIQSLLDIFHTCGEIIGQLPGFTGQLDVLKVTLGAIADFVAVIADGFSFVKSLLTLDFSGVKNSLGFGYGSGNANNLQRTIMQQNGTWQEYKDFYNSPYYSGYTGNATGNDNWKGGLTWVGENGPELVALPQGSQILNAQDSRNVGRTIYIGSIVIDAKSVKEFNDIIEMVESAEVIKGMG